MPYSFFERTRTTNNDPKNAAAFARNDPTIMSSAPFPLAARIESVISFFMFNCYTFKMFSHIALINDVPYNSSSNLITVRFSSSRVR